MAAGTFSRLERNGLNILKPGGGPRLHLWRTPHRNDDMWADRSWMNTGLKDLRWSVSATSVEQSNPSEVKISVKLLGEGMNKFTVNHDVVYTINGDGLITSFNSINSSNPQQVVARIGVRMLLDKQFEEVEYFGRGPMENYADRKRGFDIGITEALLRNFIRMRNPWTQGTTRTSGGQITNSGGLD
jgi:beta-galactosidase